MNQSETGPSMRAGGVGRGGSEVYRVRVRVRIYQEFE